MNIPAEMKNHMTRSQRTRCLILQLLQDAPQGVLSLEKISIALTKNGLSGTLNTVRKHLRALEKSQSIKIHVLETAYVTTKGREISSGQRPVPPSLTGKRRVKTSNNEKQAHVLEALI